MIFRNIDNRTALQRQLDEEARRYQAENVVVVDAAPELATQPACDRLFLRRARHITFGTFGNERVHAE